MDPDLQKKWKDAMETAKLTGGGGGNGVDTANIMLGEVSVSESRISLYHFSQYLSLPIIVCAGGRFY